MVKHMSRKRRSKRHMKRHSKHSKTHITRNMYRKKHKKTQRGGGALNYGNPRPNDPRMYIYQGYAHFLPKGWKMFYRSGYLVFIDDKNVEHKPTDPIPKKAIDYYNSINHFQNALPLYPKSKIEVLPTPPSPPKLPTPPKSPKSPTPHESPKSPKSPKSSTSHKSSKSSKSK